MQFCVINYSFLYNISKVLYLLLTLKLICILFIWIIIHTFTNLSPQIGVLAANLWDQSNRVTEKKLSTFPITNFFLGLQTLNSILCLTFIHWTIQRNKNMPEILQTCLRVLFRCSITFFSPCTDSIQTHSPPNDCPFLQNKSKKSSYSSLTHKKQLIPNIQHCEESQISLDAHISGYGSNNLNNCFILTLLSYKSPPPFLTTHLLNSIFGNYPLNTCYS